MTCPFCGKRPIGSRGKTCEDSRCMKDNENNLARDYWKTHERDAKMRKLQKQL